ncbi:MAG: hypothetical protein VB099_20975, partial [Candidatus Limiplasma sp.]|nr:hypothetical protein [Candidatus Limiplasma sp.]
TCLAATKIKGITLEKFQTHLTQSAKKYFDYKNVPMVEAEYNTETMEDVAQLTGRIASANFLAQTFKGSAIMEWAGIYLPVDDDDAASTYQMAFLFTVVDNKDAVKREKNAGKILGGLSASVSLDKNGNVYAGAKNEQYHTYLLGFGEQSVYMQVHQQAGYSIEELREMAEEKLISNSLYTQSTAEQQRGSSTILSSGEYDCPAHIAVGEYKVTPQKSGILTVERGGSVEIVEFLDPDDGDEIGRLVLKAGDVVKITSGGKMAFAPLR